MNSPAYKTLLEGIAEIHSYAHEHSTGPGRSLWEIRRMAADLLEGCHIKDRVNDLAW